MIRKFAKSLMPPLAFRVLKRSVVMLRRFYRDTALKINLRQRPLRIIIGAGGVFQQGWISTEVDQLNLLRRETWDAHFSPNTIEALIAEHVWEHLSLEEGKVAAKICYHYLKSGGYIRIAVPDGLHPDPEYREYIKVDGVGGGSIGGHKVVYTYKMLQQVFDEAGFTSSLLEYHDESGMLHTCDWDTADGKINRSKRFDSRGAVSIILDARK